MLCVKRRENSKLFRGDAPNLQEPNTMITVKEISLESLLTMDRACSGRLSLVRAAWERRFYVVK